MQDTLERDGRPSTPQADGADPAPAMPATRTPDTEDGYAPELWFATPIWPRKVLDHERIDADILTAMDTYERELPNVTRSNVGGWHSPSDLHKRPELAEIRGIIGRTCVGCAKRLAFDFTRFDLVFQEMWINRNGPRDYNRAHVHPNAILSGTYYAKVPEGAGNIEFYDPIRERIMSVYPVKERTKMNSQALQYRAAAGLLIVFPSWLQHAVEPNLSEESRVSIAFNMTFRAKSA